MIRASGCNISSYFEGGAEESHQSSERGEFIGEKNQGSAVQYQRQSSLAEEVLQARKGSITLHTKKNSTTGLDHPYDMEYNFTSRFTVSFRGCFICGATYYFSRVDYSVEINNKEERRFFLTRCGLINRTRKRGVGRGCIYVLSNLYIYIPWIQLAIVFYKNDTTQYTILYSYNCTTQNIILYNTIYDNIYNTIYNIIYETLYITLYTR